MRRTAWWALGTAIAVMGAIIARLVADLLPPGQRIPVWLAGSAVIFVGLAVLSLGTRSGESAFGPTSARQGQATERKPKQGQPKQETARGAGEGNRTLV